jgi:hypothetical protein
MALLDELGLLTSSDWYLIANFARSLILLNVWNTAKIFPINN